MSPRVRFTVWIVAVVTLLAGQLVWLALVRASRFSDGNAVLVGGLVALELPVIVIAVLLATTPPNAIKLRGTTSEGLIVIGVVLLQVWAMVMLRPDHAWRVAVVVATTILLLAILRRARRSPWWAALVAWNPLVLFLFAW